ncbi:MAG TPA: (2Fe-2S)-binding protein [Candidatus Acidoferrales bacterium]|jgi:nicotinate dehydrogenase subunit A|nr:(2Fe-2S)-binding protein [Candidatus Acidoferrales bacterium]
MSRISLTVNGKPRTIDADPSTPLLYVLRNDFQLNGPKFGCGISQCGACTVLSEGRTIRSCSVPVSSMQNRKVTTLEGLGGASHPSFLQTAFVEEQAAQCGYCANGLIMTAQALLDRNANPSDAEIKQALNANLCRCGTHLRFVRAVKRAAKERNHTGSI